MERRPSVIAVALMLIALAAVSFTAGALAKSGLKRSGEASEEVYKQLNPFIDALTLIQEKYVDEDKTKAHDLMEGALTGMVSTLDPFSQYMPPDDFKDMETETSGEFGGLGIEIALRDDRLTVITPIDGTPADRAGIKALDRIIKIGDEKTDNMSINDAVKRLRGKIGTPVTITLWREGVAQPFDVTLVRDAIKIESVRAYRLPGDFGYVRINEFIHDTSVDLDAAIAEMEKQGPLKGLVLDLRNDPGGLLEEAFKVGDLFVAKGQIIVSTRGRDKRQDYEYRGTGRKKWGKRPIVVLINEGSASASEIVSGALKDLKLALLLGTKSFGKGSVQTIFPLENSGGAALRLTTAKYYTPSGISIHGIGIQPDLDLKEPDLTESTVKAFNDKVVDDFVKTLEKEKFAANENTQITPATLKRFYDFAALKNKKLDPSDLAKDSDVLSNSILLELLQDGPGDKVARQVGVLRDRQVVVAEEVLRNGGKLTPKWAAHEAKVVKDREKAEKDKAAKDKGGPTPKKPHIRK